MSDAFFPVNLNMCVVIFIFFFMRELECATAEFRDMTVDDELYTVKLLMSVSKNDPRAIGCERQWGCVCASAANPRTCPYHAAAHIKKALLDRFGKLIYTDGFPLFPDAGGKPVTADMMLRVITTTAQNLR